MAAKKMLCIGPLRGSLESPVTEILLLSQLDVIWVAFQLWCCRLRSQAWGLDPTLLMGKSLAAHISLWNFSCRPWEPSQPSCAFSPLPTILIVVTLFLLFILGYKASLQLVFSWLFRMISLQFSWNSQLVLGGV